MTDTEQLRAEIEQLREAVGELAMFASAVKLSLANIPASAALASSPELTHRRLVSTLTWLHMDREQLKVMRFSPWVQALADEKRSERSAQEGS